MNDEVNDEFAGQGGSYVVDPKTGARTLVERTQEAQPEPVAAVEQTISRGD